MNNEQAMRELRNREVLSNIREIEEEPNGIAYECDHCGGEIFKGEEYYYINGDIVCDDCIRDYAWEHFGRVAGKENEEC